MAIAHTRNRQGNRHALVEHLRQVTALAAEFAAPFGASLFGNVLGTWHDLGKFHPDFQKYLFDAEANPQKHPRGPDHKAAGVLMALHHKQEALSLPLQGHHGGLHNRQQLKAWFEPHMARAEQALVAARLALPELNDPVALQLPPFLFIEGKLDPLRVEMFLRMLFSCLVDADFLDTEQHFEPERASARGGTRATMAELWECFERDQQRMSDRPATRVNRARAGIYQACIEAAEQPPGLYRLTVPTGGGKTRSGLAFALRHALLYDLRRVVVAVPFTTITQQTAKVFRDIFAPLAGDEPIVLEHHSASTEWGVEDEEFASAAQWSRLAAENWDAPVVVTTTVQLFESLFAASTRRCRKLHRLARSVIILDEVQSLPVSLLDPILNALTILCSDYGCTVVLSTATQPAFEMLPIFANVQAREIMPDPARHFRTLKRVAYTWHLDPPLTWEQVAALLREHAQALVVLNTKKDALALLDALGDPDALHLSTLLCGKHRQDVLEEIKRRLDNGEACRVVSTQVVEAGVDLDFPVVLRALGPLSSIFQAAGRANREGRLAQGRVIVFKPVEGGMPPGFYRRAAQVSEMMTLGNSSLEPPDMDDPVTVRHYFERLFPLEQTDTPGVQKARTALDYPETAKLFRMIPGETMDVIVAYGSEEEQAEVRELVGRLRNGVGNVRRLLRRLQPYVVSVDAWRAKDYAGRGFISPIPDLPGLGEWQGVYDPVRGLVASDGDPDMFVF